MDRPGRNEGRWAMRSTRTALFAVIVAGLTLAIAPRSWAQQSADPKAVEYMATHEPTLHQTDDSLKRLYLLTSMAPAALAANQRGKALAYAAELIQLGPAMRSTPGFGDSNF